jgi:hypothetical protein
MPVKEFQPTRSPAYDQLVRDLAAEWSATRSDRREPIILQETRRDGRVMHVYVVWSTWNDVDRTERSEIIMDAAEKCLGSAQAGDITIAMGLTPDEADRMGIRY